MALFGGVFRHFRPFSRRFAAFRGRLGAPKAMSEGYRLRVGNPIIVKDDVGRAAYSCYDLPPNGHAYGRDFPRDPEGSRAFPA